MNREGMSLPFPGPQGNWAFPGTMGFLKEWREWVAKARAECSEFVFTALHDIYLPYVGRVDRQELLSMFDDDWEVYAHSKIEKQWTKSESVLKDVLEIPKSAILFFRKSKAQA